MSQGFELCDVLARAPSLVIHFGIVAGGAGVTQGDIIAAGEAVIVVVEAGSFRDGSGKDARRGEEDAGALVGCVCQVERPCELLDHRCCCGSVLGQPEGLCWGSKWPIVV